MDTINVSPKTFGAAVLLAAAKAGFIIYVALGALDLGRAFAFAAITYSRSSRYSVMGVNASDRAVYVFDSATGEATKRSIAGME